MRKTLVSVQPKFVDIPLTSVLLTIATTLLSCGNNARLNTETGSGTAQVQTKLIEPTAPLDTSVFLPQEQTTDLLTFDDNGLVKVEAKDVAFRLVASNDGYDLSVSHGNNTLFTKKGLQGISKVLQIDNWLLFTVYSFVSEDGANEGQPVIINLTNESAKMGEKTLHNTCNPVIIDSRLYLINDLQLLETDLDFNVKRTLPISYFSKDDPYGYLDTYLISGLSIDKIKRLSIEFSPVKSDISWRFYSGVIRPKDKLILLREQ